MAGLQRSSVSFRRQGSSGLIWDDKFLQSAEILDETNHKKDNNNNHEQQQQLKEAKPPRAVRSINTLDRSRSNGGGGRGFRTGRVSPAIEPSSPKVSACGICSAFGKAEKPRRRAKSAKRRT
ncbi:MAPK kinase substrate protein At1g80180-like [Cornus florida]|uniref:MAPK kinase substrate protein At1g80180-like n=1 Tax=Cornus florida TaxID=4283 RepID=UPI00289F70E9|nr:MAPK kinase substrate protein At1g80180-like [Cornus florida]